MGIEITDSTIWVGNLKGVNPYFKVDRILCGFTVQNVTEEARKRAEANAKRIALTWNCHDDLVEACKMQQRLIDDMMRFVGKMALQDYALLNDAPVAANRAIQKAMEGHGDEPEEKLIKNDLASGVVPKHLAFPDGEEGQS